MTVQRTISLLVVVGLASAAFAAPIETAGKVQSVTVYRGQALVTRSVAIDAPSGPVELVVTDLPARIVGNSLFASGEGVLIRAVRYRSRAVEEEPRPEVRQLDQQIEAVQKEIRKLQSGQALLKQKEAYLANLESFSATKAKDDLDRGTLNAPALTSLTEFIFKQRAELVASALELEEALRQQHEKLNLLQRQRAELAAKFTRTAREAVVFLDKQAPGKALVRLNYVVDGANWSPTYNVRASSGGKEVSLEYNAMIQQVSGEDWDGVKLTLSTASPAMAAEAPILTPLWVTLGSAPMAPAGYGAELLLGGQKAAGEELRRALEGRSYKPAAPSDQLTLDWAANVAAGKLQILDLVGGKDVLLAGRAMVSADEALSVSYSLPAPVSIPSRSDQQMIQIAMLKLSGEFYYLATPVLTPYVYQHADIVNATHVALLSGPANAYMDDQFMGSGNIPMVAKGQRFTVGFGVDSQLRASRELADKTDRIQGGNRELTFKYRLLMENFKDAPVKVRLLDRLPDPRGADIRVTLLSTSDELSKDPVYLRTLRKSGILRWEIEVPANSAGAKARIVDYEYKLEFDKNMHLAEPTPTALERSKLEFREALDMMQRAQ